MIAYVKSDNMKIVETLEKLGAPFSVYAMTKMERRYSPPGTTHAIYFDSSPDSTDDLLANRLYVEEIKFLKEALFCEGVKFAIVVSVDYDWELRVERSNIIGIQEDAQNRQAQSIECGHPFDNCGCDTMLAVDTSRKGITL